jgi:hypothetical protein
MEEGDTMKQARRSVATAIVSALVFALVTVSGQAGATTATEVIRQSSPGDWTFSQTGVAVGDFQTGPSTPPAGDGSYGYTVPNGDDGARPRIDSVAGNALSTLDELSYWTYVSVNSGCQAPYLVVAVDTAGDTDADDFLFMEPCYQDGGYLMGGSDTLTPQPAVALDTWQVWDAMDAGWWSNNGEFGSSGGPPLFTLTDYLGLYPTATIQNIRVNAGFGIPITAAADMVTIGFSGDATTYDFEPDGGDCLVSTDVPNKRITMLQNCTTDETITVPDDYTWDGDGFTIQAVDPSGGHFVGAVLMNGGDLMHVTDTTVNTTGLAEVCDGGADRLRGILFEGAAGSATNNTVFVRQGTEGGVNAGNSGCQEGNGIEARNEPFDTPSAADLAVLIDGNVVADYVKGGVVTNGSVAATITRNTITGNGPVGVPSAAQNGIQVGFGATAVVKSNSVSGNVYSPKSFVACGVLLFEAGGVRSANNNLFANERNQCNVGKGGGTFNPTLP